MRGTVLGTPERDGFDDPVINELAVELSTEILITSFLFYHAYTDRVIPRFARLDILALKGGRFIHN